MEEYREKIKQLIEECENLTILEYLSVFIKYYIQQNSWQNSKKKI